MKIFVINGPNLDMLGKREPEIYGADTLESINAELTEYCKKIGVEPEFYQSNSEGAIIDFIHSARENADGTYLTRGLTRTTASLSATRFQRPRFRAWRFTSQTFISARSFATSRLFPQSARVLSADSEKMFTGLPFRRLQKNNPSSFSAERGFYVHYRTYRDRA